MEDRHRAQPGEPSGESAQKVRRVEAEVTRRQGPPVPGDLLTVAPAVPPFPRWAVVSGHPDDPALLFVVPVDAAPLGGVADVAVPAEADCGPLWLRCGLGLWVGCDELQGGAGRSGYLEEEHVLSARARLAQLARGQPGAPPQQHAAELDPDYQAHMEDLARAVAALEAALEERARRPVVLRLADFRPFAPEDVGRPGPELGAPARAAVPGALREAIGRVVGGGPSPLPMCLIPSASAGALLLVDEGPALGLVYVPEGGEPPPALRGQDASGRPLIVQWRLSPDGRGYRGVPDVPWPPEPAPIRLQSEAGAPIIIER